MIRRRKVRCCIFECKKKNWHWWHNKTRTGWFWSSMWIGEYRIFFMHSHYLQPMDILQELRWQDSKVWIQHWNWKECMSRIIFVHKSITDKFNRFAVFFFIYQYSVLMMQICMLYVHVYPCSLLLPNNKHEWLTWNVFWI